jgi:predicted nucleotidyltransferase
MNKNKIMKNELISILRKIDVVEFAYLFGSYARGDESEHSDVDVAVYLTQEHNNFDTKLKIHHKLEISLHKEIDLIVLNSVKNFNLLENIFNEGIILKDTHNDSRFMYELNKEHEIKDYKEFQRMLHVA